MTEQVPGGGKDGGNSSLLKEKLNPSSILSSVMGAGRLPFLYAALFLVLSLILFPPMQKVKDIRFKEGDIADIDVIAPLTFFVQLSEQEIENIRANAAVSVPPVYIEKPEVMKLLPGDFSVFMEVISGIAGDDTLEVEERVKRIREFAPGLRRDPVALLLEAKTRLTILDVGLRLQKRFFEKGIINDASPLRRGAYRHITVVTENEERRVQTRPLIEQGELEDLILNEAGKVFGRDDKVIKLFYGILRSHIEPNLVYDRHETKKRRDAAEKQIPKAFKVSKNQRIIAKHDKVTKKQVEMLEALEEARVEHELGTSAWKRMLLFFGKGIRVAVLLTLLGLALYRFKPRLVSRAGSTTLVFIIITFYLLLTVLVVRISYLDPNLIPIAFVSLVATACFGAMASVILTLFSALMLITHTALPASHAFVSILAGTAAIISIEQLRERKNFYRIFLYVSIAYIIGIAGLGLTEGITAGTFLLGGLWGIVNSFICTVLVMFLLPIFESLFNVTTNFTLMELSDLNRPLLKRLILETPGTYHHSLMVGNMVEAVAGDVHANSLLARVSAYYHDIGKLAKPEYFFENKGDQINKHEKLTPTMSALILASHVKEGIELARKENLPGIIMDAIREHHGTTVMAYFYQKALEYDSHDSVNIDDFRYPGPRPRSKETALIMLADSAEAAVRSLKEPTAPRIRAIVMKIFEARMNDGELDESGLTLHDIAVIREQFINFLTGIFHPRISYPRRDREEMEHETVHENNSKQPSRGEGKGRV